MENFDSSVTRNSERTRPAINSTFPKVGVFVFQSQFCAWLKFGSPHQSRLNRDCENRHLCQARKLKKIKAPQTHLPKPLHVQGSAI